MQDLLNTDEYMNSLSTGEYNDEHTSILQPLRTTRIRNNIW